jgi:uncharacterized protein with PIN domain
MAEHRYEATCPVCGGTLSDLTEVALIDKVQRHAKENHDRELTREQARGLFKDRADK